MTNAVALLDDSSERVETRIARAVPAQAETDCQDWVSFLDRYLAPKGWITLTSTATLHRRPEFG